MYIWVGCELPMAFERELRYNLREMNQQIGLDEVAFLLPQHISLKISFCVEDEKKNDVMDSVEALLRREKPFAVQLDGVEINHNVLWLKIRGNARLRALHEQLDAMLQKEHGVPQHMFDKEFVFHSTLFMDSDAAKLNKMYDLLKEFPNSEVLGIAQFCIGESESGKPGTYRVVREILV